MSIFHESLDQQINAIIESLNRGVPRLYTDWTWKRTYELKELEAKDVQLMQKLREAYAKGIGNPTISLKILHLANELKVELENQLKNKPEGNKTAEKLLKEISVLIKMESDYMLREKKADNFSARGQNAASVIMGYFLEAADDAEKRGSALSDFLQYDLGISSLYRALKRRHIADKVLEKDKQLVEQRLERELAILRADSSRVKNIKIYPPNDGLSHSLDGWYHFSINGNYGNLKHKTYICVDPRTFSGAALAKALANLVISAYRGSLKTYMEPVDFLNHDDNIVLHSADFTQVFRGAQIVVRVLESNGVKVGQINRKGKFNIGKDLKVPAIPGLTDEKETSFTDFAAHVGIYHLHIIRNSIRLKDYEHFRQVVRQYFAPGSNFETWVKSFPNFSFYFY